MGSRRVQPIQRFVSGSTSLLLRLQPPELATISAAYDAHEPTLGLGITTKTAVHWVSGEEAL